MHPPRTSLQHWLSLRVRILCAAIFVVSLFVPTYVPEGGSAQIADLPEEYSREFLLVEDGFLMKTSSLSEQGMRSAFSQGIIHTVEPNESVASIAKSAELKAETIRWANNLGANQKLQPGQKLLILPVDGVLHTVKRGQNLSSIADLYGIPDEKIRAQNQLQGGYLVAGQELIIPGGKPIVTIAAVTGKSSSAGAKTPASPVTTATKVATAVPTKEYAIEPSYGILQIPCICFYTQHFHAGHYGVDMQDKGGGPIFGAEAGLVVRADYGWNGGYGNVIEIDHGNGVLTLYAHNKELYVKEGDRVARGQVIAYMGNTGLVHGPTGIHLHFEVHVKGVKKNPLLYLQE